MKHLCYQRKIKWQIMPICIIVMLFSVNSSGEKTTAIKDSITTKLNSSLWTERSQAAAEISSNPFIDTSMAISILLNSISDELGDPHFPEQLQGSYVSNSERLLWAYTTALIKLSEYHSSILYTYIDTSDKSLTDWVILILALKQDTTVHYRVRNIVANSENSWIRSMAIKTLETYKDTTDISCFIVALKDTNSVVVSTDTFLENGKPAITVVYPVREAAIRALKCFGYITVKNPEGGYKLTKIDK